MAKTNYQSIDEYHQAFPEEVRLRLETIRQIVHKVAPSVSEVISYQIPAFKIDKYFLVYYAGFAKHVTLSNPWSEDFLSQFGDELKGLKVSRAAIQFPLNKPLPKGLIERMIKYRKKEVEALMKQK